MSAPVTGDESAVEIDDRDLLGVELGEAASRRAASATRSRSRLSGIELTVASASIAHHAIGPWTLGTGAGLASSPSKYEGGRAGTSSAKEGPMQGSEGSTWERIAPLTGVIAVVIIVLVFAVGGSTPGDHDTAAKVRDFYGAHHNKHMTLSFILILSVPFLLLFASTLRYELRRAGGTGQLANAAFAGGVLGAAGIGVLSVVHLALADAADSTKTIGTTQVLNVLDNNDFLPMAAGLAVLVLGAGLSAVRHGGLPKWLGWAGVVIGVAMFTPAGFFAFLLSGIWILIASILLTLARQSAGQPAAPVPAA